MNNSLVLENGIIFDNKKGGFQFQNNDGSDAGDLSNIFRNIVVMDPQLTDGLNKTAPNFKPTSASPALNTSLVAPVPANDTFFERVNFLGGIGPNDSDDWTKGWTSFRRN